ncbi:hypothetical protein DFJ74DRAFT_131088 [Hyaloraphidium curvatum]|nr:hypothetical protein DFJ74DRAFT_131088 [Hyaloraphidium curvatum]
MATLSLVGAISCASPGRRLAPARAFPSVPLRTAMAGPLGLPPLVATFSMLPPACLERVCDFLDRGSLSACLLSCKALSWPAVRRLWREPPAHTSSRALFHLARTLRPQESCADPPNRTHFDYAAYVQVLNLSRRWMEKEHAWIFDHIIRCVGPNLRSLSIRYAIARRLRNRGFEIAFSCPGLVALTMDHEDPANHNLLPEPMPNLRVLHLHRIEQCTKTLLVRALTLFGGRLTAFSFNCSDFSEVNDDTHLEEDEIVTMSNALSTVTKLRLSLPTFMGHDDRIYWRIFVFETVRKAQFEELALHDGFDQEAEPALPDNLNEEDEAALDFPDDFDEETAFDFSRMQDTANGTVTPYTMQALLRRSGAALRSLEIKSDGLSPMGLRDLHLWAPCISRLVLATNQLDDNWDTIFCDVIALLRRLDILSLSGFPEVSDHTVVELLKTCRPLFSLELRIRGVLLVDRSPLADVILHRHGRTLESLRGYADMSHEAIGRFLHRLGRATWKSKAYGLHPMDPRIQVPIRTAISEVVLDYTHEYERHPLPGWMWRLASRIEETPDVGPEDPSCAYDTIHLRGAQLRTMMFVDSIERFGLWLLGQERARSLRMKEEERRYKEIKAMGRAAAAVAAAAREGGKNKGVVQAAPDAENDDAETSDLSDLEEDVQTEADSENMSLQASGSGGPGSEPQPPSVHYDSDGREIMSDADTEAEDWEGEASAEPPAKKQRHE